MVMDNWFCDVIEVLLLGCWVFINVGIYDVFIVDSSIFVVEYFIFKFDLIDFDLVEGEVIFLGDKFWWIQGVFEFCYYYGGKYFVMVIFELFEICIVKVVDDDVDGEVCGVIYEKVVLVVLFFVVCNCFDCDEDIVLIDVDELFGSYVEWDGKYVRRIVYVIREMFGIEFVFVVVFVDGNVRKFVWRICNVKEVLVSYSFMFKFKFK